MLESEWLAAKDATTMLTLLQGRASDRKLRLFACALGRRLWPRLTSEAVREAVEIAEQVADGQADHRTLKSVWEQALKAIPEQGKHAHWAAAHSLAPDIQFWAGAAACQAGMTGLRKARVANVVREIFENPFRPVTLDATCRGPLVLSLARATYDERSLPAGEFMRDRVLVLADALEDAGADPVILGHLHGPGPHVSGCWVIDLCLGLR